MKNKMRLSVTITIFVFVLTLFSCGNITATAATKKPTAITKITKVQATETTLKIKFKKAKRAKGYQIRVYKTNKKKLIKATRTKKTTVILNKLQPDTKYKIKVRAYTKSGKKYVYGTEKSITFKTMAQSKTPTNPSPTPSVIVQPGNSTSTGEQLITEYNTWVNNYTTECAEGNWDTKYKELVMAHVIAPFEVTTDGYTNKYDAYKYAKGTHTALAHVLADVYNALGISAKVIRLHDYDKYGYMNPYWDNFEHVCLADINSVQFLCYPINIVNELAPTQKSYLNKNEFNTTKEYRMITFVCPLCNNENFNWLCLDIEEHAEILKNPTNREFCQKCKLIETFTNPFYNIDTTNGPYTLSGKVIAIHNADTNELVWSE